MSLSSPIHTTRSFLSPKQSGYLSSQILPDVSPGISRTYALSTKSPLEGLNLTPDELFAKHTVAEVRAVQQRLRADADAKQEELRLMVGERYRDLLQASTSIIAIAKSSQHVLEALEESREAIISQHDTPLPPKTASVDGLHDKHLSALQVLSAHMKLLLDAPEHLWRLIEQKSYLQAAWLFLLSRVVHRALVRQDDNDEQSWANEGIDVLVEFPLVQRQWEVVSQFRSQIIHKSTLSLREATSLTEDTCATLTTLHLLDSRPLTETLGTLLSQRTKTLQSILSRNPASGKEPSSVREVTQTMKKAFNVIAHTVATAKTVFQDEPSSPSLIRRVLQTMQEDTFEARSTTISLPGQLQITTQSLLTQLTSSANFQLLPANLRSYKPYVDLNSTSTHLPSAELSRRVQEWFEGSCGLWQNSAERWLLGLQTLKEVWTLRNWMRRCISSSALTPEEVTFILTHQDALFHARITGIWEHLLSDAEIKFRNTLYECISTPKQSTGKDSSPVEVLFQSPSIPVITPTIKSFVDTPLQQYQLSLKRQLVGRAAHLDAVLLTVEQCARAIQQDILHIQTDNDPSTRSLIEQLMRSYQPAANTMAEKVVNIIDQATVDTTKSHDSSAGLVFLSRITDDLMSSSSFIDNINCLNDSARDFRLKVSAINKNVLRRWGDITIQSLIQECKSKVQTATTSTGVSTALLHGLLSLCDRIRQLGIIHHPIKHDKITQEALRSFIALWDKEIWGKVIEDHELFDNLFLADISAKHGEAFKETTEMLSAKLISSSINEAAISETRQSVTEYISRTQTLFAVLFPPPIAPSYDNPLCRFGSPSVGQAQQSAIDLARPSPRFGLLLVGNVNADR